MNEEYRAECEWRYLVKHPIENMSKEELLRARDIYRGVCDALGWPYTLERLYNEALEKIDERI